MGSIIVVPANSATRDCYIAYILHLLDPVCNNLGPNTPLHLPVFGGQLLYHYFVRISFSFIPELLISSLIEDSIVHS